MQPSQNAPAPAPANTPPSGNALAPGQSSSTTPSSNRPSATPPSSNPTLPGTSHRDLLIALLALVG
ncbi:MAG: DUF2894 domain-containing protein, partial [Planctomycetaceae bacterium]